MANQEGAVSHKAFQRAARRTFRAALVFLFIYIVFYGLFIPFVYQEVTQNILVIVLAYTLTVISHVSLLTIGWGVFEGLVLLFRGKIPICSRKTVLRQVLQYSVQIVILLFLSVHHPLIPWGLNLLNPHIYFSQAHEFEITENQVPIPGLPTRPNTVRFTHIKTPRNHFNMGPELLCCKLARDIVYSINKNPAQKTNGKDQRVLLGAESLFPYPINKHPRAMWALRDALVPGDHALFGCSRSQEKNLKKLTGTFDNTRIKHQSMVNISAPTPISTEISTYDKFYPVRIFETEESGRCIRLVLKILGWFGFCVPSGLGTYSPGDKKPGKVIFQAGGLKIAPLICSEVFYVSPEEILARADQAGGCELIIISAYDRWFHPIIKNLFYRYVRMWAGDSRVPVIFVTPDRAIVFYMA